MTTAANTSGVPVLHSKSACRLEHRHIVEGLSPNGTSNDSLLLPLSALGVGHPTVNGTPSGRPLERIHPSPHWDV